MTQLPQTSEVMTGWKLRRTVWRDALTRLRRRYIPYLVWWGEELDVLVTLKENRLLPVECSDPGEAVAAGLSQLNRGSFHEIEKLFGDVGIKFDTGLGYEGRDWEWDWSLRGPISVKFRGKASKPERRE